MNSPDETVARLSSIRAAIARAARDVGRGPEDITLVAVSKTVPVEAIEPALAAGQRAYGENYVQEAKAKWPRLRERYPDAELHFIGPLQSNKAPRPCGCSTPSTRSTGPRWRRRWRRKSTSADAPPGSFVQVNTGEEPQKGRRAARREPMLFSRAAATNGGSGSKG